MTPAQFWHPRRQDLLVHAELEMVERVEQIHDRLERLETDPMAWLGWGDDAWSPPDEVEAWRAFFKFPPVVWWRP